MGETCWGGKGCCQVSSPALHLISDSSPILIFLCCWSHRAQQQIIFPWCDDRCLVPLSRCLLSGPPLLSRPLQHGYTTRQHVECGKLYNHQKAAWRKSRYFDKADYDETVSVCWLAGQREGVALCTEEMAARCQGSHALQLLQLETMSNVHERPLSDPLASTSHRCSQNNVAYSSLVTFVGIL